MADQIHPNTRANVHAGSRVVTRDARGEFHQGTADSDVELGRDFLVVWIYREGQSPEDAVPWPAEDVWLPGDEPGGGDA
jgi:hypothetical protein